MSAEPEEPRQRRREGPEPRPPLEILDVLHDPQPDEELIMHLEPDQLVAETFRRVPAAALGPAALRGLWALRVFVVLVSVMVIYTFIARLH